MSFTEKLAEALWLIEDNEAADSIFDEPAEPGTTVVANKVSPRRKQDMPDRHLTVAAVAANIRRILNPYDKNAVGGTADWVAPETIKATAPFDDDFIVYFYKVLALHDRQLARLWRPAVEKYRNFEDECERLMSESVTTPGYSKLANKIDRITFDKIISGIQRIAGILGQANLPNLINLRAAFTDFATYVHEVAPLINRYLDLHNLN